MKIKLTREASDCDGGSYSEEEIEGSLTALFNAEKANEAEFGVSEVRPYYASNGFGQRRLYKFEVLTDYDGEGGSCVTYEMVGSSK